MQSAVTQQGDSAAPVAADGAGAAATERSTRSGISQR